MNTPQATLVNKSQLVDYVTKIDFGEFKEEMSDFRAETEVRFDSVDSRFDLIDKRFDLIDNRFVAADKRFVAIESRLSSIDKRLNGIDKKFDQLDDSIRRTFGTYYEQFREDLRTSMEYVMNVENKKVDKEEFEALKVKINQRFYDGKKVF